MSLFGNLLRSIVPGGQKKAVKSIVSESGGVSQAADKIIKAGKTVKTVVLATGGAALTAGLATTGLFGAGLAAKTSGLLKNPGSLLKGSVKTDSSVKTKSTVDAVKKVSAKKVSASATKKIEKSAATLVADKGVSKFGDILKNAGTGALSAVLQSVPGASGVLKASLPGTKQSGPLANAAPATGSGMTLSSIPWWGWLLALGAIVFALNPFKRRRR